MPFDTRVTNSQKLLSKPHEQVSSPAHCKSHKRYPPINFLLGHSSIQTTERYLGSEQDIEIAVNDNLGL